MKIFAEVLEKLRADETRQLRRDSYETFLTKSCWRILKKRENLPESQTFGFQELQKHIRESDEGLAFSFGKWLSFRMSSVGIVESRLTRK
jgi:hypothetical protein